jgi:lambda family phage portal protein
LTVSVYQADPEIMALLGDVGAPPTAQSGTPLPGLVPLGGDRAMVGGAFEGADRFDSMLATWSPSMQSADQDLLSDKPMLDARVKDTLRNDAYVSGGEALHKDNIVGSMFMLNAKPVVRALGKGFDDTWEEEFQEEVEAKFNLAGESQSCWFDATRRNTFTEIIRLAVGVYVQSGELLASVEWIRQNEQRGRPFSTAIQMIDLDRLSDPRSTTSPGIFDLISKGRLRGGVELDSRGQPVAYHIQNRHPSEWWGSDIDKWKRVPARLSWGRPQMIHIYEQNRVDQTRGVAGIVSALKELRITKRFRDVVLQNAVLNATYAATIESELDSNAIMARMGASGSQDYEGALNGYIGGWMSQIAEYAKGAKGLQMNGVRVPHLPPGTKLKLTPAGQGGPLGSEFEQSLLRYIAASLGVSYEQLSRDYTNTNYSSARAAMNETWKFMVARKRVVADRMANHIYRLWLEELLNKDLIESMPLSARAQGWLYEDPMRLDALTQAEWIGASRGQIDELKETQAAALRLKYKLTTHEYEIARLGGDWRRNFRQSSREKKLAESLEITIDDIQSDQMNAASGSARESNGKGNTVASVLGHEYDEETGEYLDH